MQKEKLVVILGPTASGKTKLAVMLAKKFNGEIVSADSRQVYKGMDIATGKASKKEMREVPHHLIDIINPNEKFNAALYKKLAIKKIKEIHKKGKLPFLVGGTGLYIQAVVDNIDFPKVMPRPELREKLEKKSIEQLFEAYKKLDPKGSETIEKQNKRRLIRAIEVCKATGKTFFEQKKKGKPLFTLLQIGIDLKKQKLETKISQRVGKMFKIGIKQEAKRLIKKYGWISSLQTIGYQEWLPYLNGESDEKETIKKIVLHTIQFAKRQRTWFKRDKRIIWINSFQTSEKLIRDWLCP